ncbi:bifunctional protein TilS/HprT [uncultured bacterium]|nr:bifunctional protein TilS/HprT [uncultured bacterium]
MPGLIQQVKQTIKERKMLSRGQRIVAAVSGGADSVVMLHVLLELREEYRLAILAAHMDHGLRGVESRADHDFVRDLAKRLGLQFVSRRLKKGELKGLGTSPQEAARLKRYAFFEEAARGFKAQRVALGHTTDDQAETVLMRLLKGSSLSGLAGIPPQRGIFIRPLIDTSRASIEEYAKERGISFVTDSTNLTVKYLRNRVRLELIPALAKEYNPSIKETLARTAAVLAGDDDFIEKAAEKTFAGALVERKAGSIAFDRGKMKRPHRALSARAFLMAVRSLGVESELSSVHVEAFFEIMDSSRPNASISLPGGIKAMREYGIMRIEAGKPSEASFFEQTLAVPGIARLQGIGVIKAELVKPPKKFSGEADTAWFDYDALSALGPVIVRQARPGDRMAPFGMTGHRKLKEIFIDSKVPLAARKRTPVVTVGEDVLWLAGLRQSALFSVTKGTGRVLKLVFTKVTA